MNVMPEMTTPEDAGMSSERLARLPDYFQTYLERKKFSGLSMLISRGGKVVHQSHQGVMDWDTGQPIEADTLFRIYSMTKPITSVALMMLYEEGAFRLEHEVFRYLPEFRDVQVFDSGNADNFTTRAPDRPIQVCDLLTHTSGLTYDFIVQHPVDKLYRRAKLRGIGAEDMKLEAFVHKLAEQPLVFSPGTKWNYSFATDVCGRLVEVLSGKPLDRFFEERIFQPLGMSNTFFRVPQDKAHRLASCYERDPQTKEITLQDPGATSVYLNDRAFLSGGGGLVSSLGDYHRFCRMLLNGGVLDGARILSPTTIDFMTQNHLPGGKTMVEMGDETFSETRMDGSGFGLGFSMVLSAVEAMAPVSEGAYSWGGAASTYFWIDPAEELIGIMMTQFMPSGAYPMRPQFQQLTYAAITE